MNELAWFDKRAYYTLSVVSVRPIFVTTTHLSGVPMYVRR